MKIFSWVHRQFLHKVAKNDDNDKVGLLENEAFSGACDGWKDGILAIGTMGVDLFQEIKMKDDIFMIDQVLLIDDDGGDGGHDNDGGDGDHDDEMECPLVRNASKHGFDDHVHHEKQDLSSCDEVAKPNNHQDVVKDAMKVRKTGERITLADLLREDTEDNLFKKLCDDHKIKDRYNDHDDGDNNNNNNNNNNSNSNSNAGTESIRSFLISKEKKKLRKDNLAQPVKKTKQLMRKLLRRKIHPDNGIQKESSSIVCREMNVHAI